MGFRYPPMSRTRSNAGQALGLVLCAVAFIAIVAVGVSRFGIRLVQSAHAQTAADAAALAGVTGGSGAAERVAGANGATVISWSAGEGDFTVTVRFGAAVATARASQQPNDLGRAHMGPFGPSTLFVRGQQRSPPQPRATWCSGFSAPNGAVSDDPHPVARRRRSPIGNSFQPSAHREPAPSTRSRHGNCIRRTKCARHGACSAC